MHQKREKIRGKIRSYENLNEWKENNNPKADKMFPMNSFTMSFPL